MSKFLRKLFNKPKQPLRLDAGEWGKIIYAHVTNLYGPSYDRRKEEKARRQINDRGLSFGSIQIRDSMGSGQSVKIALQSESSVPMEKVEQALRKAVTEFGLEDKIELKPGFFSGSILAEITSLAEGELKGQSVSGFNGSDSFQRTEFLTIQGSSSMDGHSALATSVLVRTAELLGFRPGPLHYAYESPVNIRDIVVYAVRWKDPQTGYRYLDVLFRSVLVKHNVFHGANTWDERAEADLKGWVLATYQGGDWWPKISINNRPVYSTIVGTPTQAILAARQKFAERSRMVCKICGKPATHEVELVKGVFGDSFFGGTDFACDDKSHIQELRSRPCVSSSVRPHKPEFWGS